MGDCFAGPVLAMTPVEDRLGSDTDGEEAKTTDVGAA
jgi:hypothetical protein